MVRRPFLSCFVESDVLVSLKDQPKPLLAVICGLDKPFRTQLSDGDYEHVRNLGTEYVRRNPRSLA
jgi:hypothetical protein